MEPNPTGGHEHDVLAGGVEDPGQGGAAIPIRIRNTSELSSQFRPVAVG
jgi:hypothetical protein